MLTYGEIIELIPASSRNTAAQDVEFAVTIITAVLDRLQDRELTIQQVADLLWPKEVMKLSEEEQQHLLWVAQRLRSSTS